MAKSGRFEEAALRYEKLDLWNEAKDCRTLAKKKHAALVNLEEGKLGTVSLLCPHCGSSQPVEAKSSQETCSHCGTIYHVPEKVIELLGGSK